METFVTAYLALWLAVVLYVGRLGLRQRRLQQMVDALQEHLQRDACGDEPPTNAT